MNLMKQKTSKPKWKLIEEIVAILEKSLTPFAKVEHNVRLPVIGRSGERQCDVVIRYGDSPRQFIVIVEVQERKTKPDITTFDGWVAKMRSVGAQRLICVSAVGYPKSIIDEVKLKHGSTVLLLTLEELQTLKIGNIIFSFKYAFELTPKFSFKSIGPAKLKNPPLDKGLQFTNYDKVFKVEKETNCLSLYDLISKCLNEISLVERSKGLPDLGDGTVRFVVGSTTKNLWLYIGEQRFKILELPIEVEVNTQQSKIPLTYHAYKQDGVNSPLAWAVSLENKGTLIFRISSQESSEIIETQPLNIQLSGVILKYEISFSISSLNQQIM